MSQFNPAPLGGGNKLIASYSYDGNKMAKITAMDAATGTFTATAHGFINGEFVFPSLLGANDLNATYPSGLSQQHYYIVGATTNTFQISTSSGGAAVTFTNNSNFASIQFQKATINGIDFTGLPTMTKCVIRAIIFSSLRDTQFGNIILPIGDYWSDTGDFRPNPLSAGKLSIGKACEFGCFLHMFIDGSKSQKMMNVNFATSFTNGADPKISTNMNESYLGVPQNPQSYPFNGIHVGFYNTNIYLANGTWIEVYEA